MRSRWRFANSGLTASALESENGVCASSVKPCSFSKVFAASYAAVVLRGRSAQVCDLGQQHPDVLGIHVQGAALQRAMDDLRAADVGLEHDVEALRAQRLAVELAEDPLLGEVLRADADLRSVRGRRATGARAVVVAPAAAEQRDQRTAPPATGEMAAHPAQALARTRGVVASAGRHRRQGEMKRAALAGAARHPDPSAVLVDDALADGQPDAGARVVLLAVQALERLEDALGMLEVHADAVVAHREAPAAVVALGEDAHARSFLTGELHRVPDEVLKDAREVRAVREHDRELADGHLRAAALDRAGERLERLLDDALGRHLLERQASAAGARVLEQVADQPARLLRRAADPVDEIELAVGLAACRRDGARAARRTSRSSSAAPAGHAR